MTAYKGRNCVRIKIEYIKIACPKNDGASQLFFKDVKTEYLLNTDCSDRLDWNLFF